MSNYKFEYKRKCWERKLEPVRMTEYMVFKDKIDMKKFVILKFFNRKKYSIIKAKFELIELNDKDEVIRKSSYVFDQLNLKPEKSVVPSNKIIINDACESIKTRLIYAKTNDNMWENGDWIENKVNEDSDLKPCHHKITLAKNIKFRFALYTSIGILIIFIGLIVSVYYALQP